MVSIERGIPTTLCPAVTTSDRPCAIPSVPSVVMNGGISNAAISAPFRKPKQSPTASAAAKTGASGAGETAGIASMMEAKVSTAPIDKSSPSVMMIRVIGSANSSRIVDWVSTLAILGGVAKPGLVGTNTMHSAISAITTPGTRAICAGSTVGVLIGGSRDGRYWLQSARDV